MPYPINQRVHQFNSIQSVPVSFGLWDTALKFLSPGPHSDVTDPLAISMSFPTTLVLAAALENFKTILVLVIFLFSTDVIQFNRHKLWCPQKRVSFAIINYVSSSDFVLALTSAVSNLPNITSIFYHFP